MKENYVFHILTEYLNLLAPEVDVKISEKSAVPIKAVSGDAKFAKIKKISEQLQRENKYLFFSWGQRRHYTKDEIQNAKLFHLIPRARVAPEGDRCGTVYDETYACPHCGAGACIDGDLYLSLTRLPKTSDIAMSISGEIIVSQRLVDVFTSAGISDAIFKPLHRKKRKDTDFCGWYEWQMSSSEVDIAPQTLVGDKIFGLKADDEKYVCPLGDTIGLNLLSELSVFAASYCGKDVGQTRQYIGRRSGVIHPQRQILVSPRVRNIFVSHGLKGADFEVVHLV